MHIAYYTIVRYSILVYFVGDEGKPAKFIDEIWT